MDLTADVLLDVGFDAVDDGPSLPEDLRARTLTTATTRREPRHPDWDTEPGRPALAAFLRTAAELGALLASLGPAEWDVETAVADSTVRELVAHLVGVERYALGQLGRRPALPAPGREDHCVVARLASADVRGAPAAELTRTWWSEVLAVTAVGAELGPSHPISFHQLPTDIRGLFIVRTFELWTHGDDVRRATRRPLNLLDADRLSLMSRQLLHVLSRGMAVSGTAQPGRTARINLTGDAAASYDVALAPGEVPGPPDVIITTSALDICRLAANRLPIAQLDAEVGGDRSLLEPILVGAGAFALD